MINTPSSKLLWDEIHPCLRLEGSGSKSFLHGQTTADVNSMESGSIFPSCWLTPTGRVRALLEIRLDDLGADVLILSGDCKLIAESFEKVIFPADKLKLIE